MTRRSILLIVAALLSTYLPASACEPRGKKTVRIEGTVEAVQQGQIDIAVGRRSESLLVTERTRILRSGAEADASALRAGDRIVVQGVRLGSAQIEAREIRTGGQSDRAPMGSATASGGHKH